MKKLLIVVFSVFSLLILGQLVLAETQDSTKIVEIKNKVLQMLNEFKEKHGYVPPEVLEQLKKDFPEVKIEEIIGSSTTTTLENSQPQIKENDPAEKVELKNPTLPVVKAEGLNPKEIREFRKNLEKEKKKLEQDSAKLNEEKTKLEQEQKKLREDQVKLEEQKKSKEKKEKPEEKKWEEAGPKLPYSTKTYMKTGITDYKSNAKWSPEQIAAAERDVRIGMGVEDLLKAKADQIRGKPKGSQAGAQGNYSLQDYKSFEKGWKTVPSSKVTGNLSSGQNYSVETKVEKVGKGEPRVGVIVNGTPWPVMVYCSVLPGKEFKLKPNEVTKEELLYAGEKVMFSGYFLKNGEKIPFRHTDVEVPLNGGKTVNNVPYEWVYTLEGFSWMYTN